MQSPEDAEAEARSDEAEMRRLFAEMLMEHKDCAWTQIGRCVWCADHRIRMYQGHIPKGHKTAESITARRRNRQADEMRARFGK